MVKKTALLINALTAFLAISVLGDDWPQWRGPNRDGAWREKGIVEKFDGPQLKLKWSVPISGGYSGPTVANGRVYVTDRIVDPGEQERVHCFEWQNGKPLWSYAYDCSYRTIGYQTGPRASVTVQDGRAYSLGAVGHFYCFDAASGKVLWNHDLNAEYGIIPRTPDWGVSAAPLVEKDLVVAHFGGQSGACLVAFDCKTGKERWRAIDDAGNYAAPIVIEHARKRVLICWTANKVVGLDPQSGKLYWEYSFPALRMPLGIATPIVNKDLLYLTGFYDGSLMLRLKPDGLAVEKVWQRRGQNELNTDALHSIISTPLFLGDYIYGVDSYGELRCLDAKTGDRVWEDLTAVPRTRWATIHCVQNGERTWMFNEKGQLIIAKLSQNGFEEISRTQLIKPTLGQLPEPRRGGVCWAHPAFAYKHVFARNDEELVCASLEAK